MTVNAAHLLEYWVDAWQRTILFWDVQREARFRRLEHILGLEKAA